MRSAGILIALASLLLLPLASAAPLRGAVFCDSPPPPTVSWYNGPGLRCGVNVKSSTQNCVPLGAGVYVCADALSSGNILLVGAVVPVDPLCGGSGDCWGIDLGFWGSGHPGGACVLVIETPGNDILVCS
jgi:hypothetical protein